LLQLQAVAGNAAVSTLVGHAASTRGTVLAVQRGFGELRVAERKAQRRRDYTTRFFSKVKDAQLREAYVSRLQRYLDEGQEDNEYWDLETIEQIVSKRAPKAPWHDEERQNFQDKLRAKERQQLLPTLPWYQRQQLEAIESRVRGWAPEEQALARELLWQWIELQNRKIPAKEIKELILGLVKGCYEQWLRAVDDQRMAWFEAHRHSIRDLMKARAGGDKPEESWFASANSPGPLRLLDIERYMRGVSAADDIAPIDAVSMWVWEYRKRTNKELLEQDEYLQKVLSVVNVGVAIRVGLGRVRPGGTPPPAPPRPQPTSARPTATEPTTGPRPEAGTGAAEPQPSPTGPSTSTRRTQADEPARDRTKAAGSRSDRDESASEAKRGRPRKAEKEEEVHKDLRSGKVYTVKENRVWPGEPPDIGVMEIRDDGSVYIVQANRKDVAAKTGSGTHGALASDPDGLGAPTAGAARYRMTVRNGLVTDVEPLSSSVTQTDELLRAVEQALRDAGLVSSPTIIRLMPNKPQSRLNKRINP
jgi:hypothetical protein